MKDSDINNGEIIGALGAGGAVLLAHLFLGSGFTWRAAKSVIFATFVGGFLGRVIWNRLFPAKANEPSVD